MNRILFITIFLSLSASVLILGILLFLQLFGHRLSMRFRYYIWLIVAIRLLVPLNPPFSLLNQPLPWTENLGNPLSAYAYEVYDNELNYSLMPEGQRDALYTGRNGFLNVLPYLWAVWAAGALALFIRKITVYQSFAKFIRASRKETANIEQLDFISSICEQLGLGQSVDVYTNDLIASPMIIGIWRPHIVLPSFSLPEDELRNIYLHELTHLKRGDIYYKWLMQVILCIHWFNPLVHVMVRQVNRYCELSCDEAVISHLGGKQEIDQYAATLLLSLDAEKRYQEPGAAITMSENAENLKERLEKMKNHPAGRRPFLLSLLLVLSLTTAGLLIGAYPSAAAGTSVATLGTPNPRQVKSEQADVAAMALIVSHNADQTIWYGVGYYLPYMTREGINEAVACYNARFPDHPRRASHYYGLEIPSQEETKIRADAVLYMSNYNFWLVEALFPYMSRTGIEEVILSHNEITADTRNPEDYY